MNRKKGVGVLGLTLFAIGMIWGGLWLAGKWLPHLGASTVNIVSALPAQPMGQYCPHVLALNEMDTLTATLHNPSPDMITYRVSFSTLKESGQQPLSGCEHLWLTIDPGATRTAYCNGFQLDKFPDYVEGDLISIRVSAAPDADADIMHPEENIQPITHQATCLIDVTRNPDLSGKQSFARILIPIMALLLLGAALSIASLWPFSRKSILLAILIMLPVLGWLGVVIWYLGR